MRSRWSKASSIRRQCSRALKKIEREFGRRPGKRWGARVLDLDLVAWDGARFASRRLTIPHPRLGERDFVLGPLAAIAPGWRVVGALTPRHLASRLGKRRRAANGCLGWWALSSVGRATDF